MNGESRPKAAPDSDAPIVPPRRDRHEIRTPAGQLMAVHCRYLLPDGAGKHVWWERPDGSAGLDGLKTADLPLYLSESAERWSDEYPVILPEGEMAADALAANGYQVVATVTGAASAPERQPLMVLAGKRVILWPDHDQAGREHMLKVAGKLDGIAASIEWVEWGDEPGDDATDAVRRGVNLKAILESAGPAPEVRPPATKTSSSSKVGRPSNESTFRKAIARFNAEHGVCEVLLRDWDTDPSTTQPGRSIRCPAHDDSSPSLSISKDDDRVWCHVPACILAGDLTDKGSYRGHDAFSLAVLAEEQGLAQLVPSGPDR